MANKVTGVGITKDVAEEVGTRLKVARESAKMTTNSVADRTKIREHFIVAIEVGDWDLLPPGLNGRGLIRNYAKELHIPVPELEPKHTTTNFAQMEAAQQYQSSQRGVPAAKVLPSAAPVSLPKAPPQKWEDLSKKAEFKENPKVFKSKTSDIATPDVMSVLGMSEGPKTVEKNKEEVSQSAPVAEKVEAPIEAPTPVEEHVHVQEPVSQVEPESVPASAFDLPDDVPPLSKQPEIPEFNPESSPAAAAYLQNNEEVIKEKKRKSTPTTNFTIGIAAAAFIIGGIFLTRIVMTNVQKSESKVSTVVVEEAPISEREPEDSSTLEDGQENSVAMETKPIAEPEVVTPHPNLEQAAEPAVTSAPTLAVVETPAPTAAPATAKMGAGPRKAMLEITGAVKINVWVDGALVLTGIKDPGAYPLNFSKRAEILVEDGSQVTLKYENWDHGPLGTPGRQRRIVLNATPLVQN